jgi:hypothetical protein
LSAVDWVCWIAFSTVDGKIKKTPSNGGPAITLTDGSFNNGATWGDDDTIVYSSATGLMRVPASGGPAEPLTKVARDKGEVRHLRPQFRQTALAVHGATGHDPQLPCRPEAGQLPPRGSGRRQWSLCRKRPSAQHAPGTLFALPLIWIIDGDGTEAPVTTVSVRSKFGRPITPCRRRGCSSTSNHGRRAARR